MNESRGALLLIGALLGGASLGALAHSTGYAPPLVHYIAFPIGKIWLNLLLALLLPLATSALVLGVLELTPGSMARAGARILGLTVFLSGSAVAIGLLAARWFRPGDGFDVTKLPGITPPVKDGVHTFIDQFPRGADNLLPWLVLALVAGVALRTIRPESYPRAVDLVRTAYDLSVAAVALVMRVAPIGIGAMAFEMAGKGGIIALWPVGKFVLVVLGALSVQMFVVYPVVLLLLARRSPLAFFDAIRPAMLVAFTTSSSAVTLPTAIAVADQRLRLPPETTRFVLTIGATGNQNGTALFEGLGVLFLAQAYHLDLDPVQQAGVVLVAMLGGIGTAGVPGGAIAVITAVSVSLGMPPEAIGLIVGVDRLLDMSRTTLNVAGDLVIATVVADHAPPSAGVVEDLA